MSAADCIGVSIDTPGSAQPLDQLSPSGVVGGDTACQCRCGATTRSTRDPQRCARGHVLKDNTAALIVGERSRLFWQAAEAVRREIRTTALADAGHDERSASRALWLACDGLAQAALIRDSAFEHIVRSGGPLTSAERERRAAGVWLSAMDRVERHLRLLGLERKAHSVSAMSAADYLRATDRGLAAADHGGELARAGGHPPGPQTSHDDNRGQAPQGDS